MIKGLEQLATGQSYAEVGRWAHRVTGYQRTRRRPGETTNGGGNDQRSVAADDARNTWHVAADWTESFAPVIFDAVEHQLRAVALEHRARNDDAISAGRHVEHPQVLLIDDVPVYGQDLERGKSRRDGGFFLLVAAETSWVDDDPVGRLRLIRAYPKSNTAAWLLMFDELGYEPDYVVADAGTGIVAAIDNYYDPARTKFVPSMWHLNERISRALSDTKGAHTITRRGSELIEPLREHCRQLRRGSTVFSAAATWAQWWDDLEDTLQAHNLAIDKIRTQRRNNEARVAAILDDLHRHPRLPISTGGLETLIAKHVQPLLARRRTAFGNIERTNSLFDLVISHHHGAFDHPGELAKLLRNDANQHDGWTVALRSIADPRPRRGNYSSLRDATLLTDLATQRGLM